MDAPIISILKASGTRTPFSASKLHKSLQRSGASDAAIQSVIDDVQKQLYNGIPTSKIYRLAFDILKDHSKHVASRYKLKQAIMELGPSGFPFERYVAEILKYHGFQVQVDVILKGHCVNHEVDVVAEKGAERLMIECKYHNSTRIICDVKIPLYIQARFADVQKGQADSTDNTVPFSQGWVVTNTKFSEDAIQYGLCMGLHLVGWNFPENGSLRYQIDQAGLYPLTCLISLSHTEKQQLLDNKVILCREIRDNKQLLLDAGISPNRIETIQQEARILCEEKVAI